MSCFDVLRCASPMQGKLHGKKRGNENGGDDDYLASTAWLLAPPHNSGCAKGEGGPGRPLFL